jgi:hypothetical protein
MRVLVATVAAMLATAAPASATLVYRQPATGAIVAARDDGSDAHVIAHGEWPAVSPDGRRVAYLAANHGLAGPIRLVDIGGGASRLLMRNGYAPRMRAAVWSSDSRHLIAGQRRDAAWLIDVVKRRRRKIPLTDSFGGATFSADGLFALAADSRGQGDRYLAITRLGTKKVTRISGRDALPVWGSRVLAYAHTSGATHQVLLRRAPGASPRVLIQSTGNLVAPIAWSGDGGRLLIAAGGQALVVNAATGATTTLGPALSAVDGLSKDGQHVLAEMGGNVVTVDPAGNVTVLAHGAATPSWTDGAYL